MKRTCLYLIVSVLCAFKVIGAPVELINIDFTRDSVIWKTKFPVPAWSATHEDFFIPINDIQSEDYLFKGTWGRFNPGTTVGAQPMCTEDITKNHRWAFRIDNTGNSYIELPVLTSAGKITIFCKNGNESLEGVFYIQKGTGDAWETIKTMFVPPHYNQNYEMQMEEYLNINSSVKLRIFGATKNIHVYAVRINSFDLSEPKEKFLRMVLIPDPQAYAKNVRQNVVYYSETLWMNNNSDSISFVLCQGDITGGNNDTQWKVAGGALSLLEGKKIPFTFIPGNHDLGDHADTRDASLMNKYLPYSRYSRNSYFGGAFETDKMENTWCTFSKDEYKFLILSLEYVPRNKVLDWAKTIIEQHPNYNVILNTHAYLDTHDQLADTVGSELCYNTGDEFANDGVHCWEKLVSQYPNFLFVFNGHVGGSGNLVGTGIHGNKVYQFHANYDDAIVAEHGMMRLVDLDPENRSFTIRTYSPFTKMYKPEEEVHFTDVNFIKDTSSGIKDLQSGNIKLMLNGKSLSITNENYKDINTSVFNLQGIKIIQRSGNGAKNIMLPASGCYIIHAIDKNGNVLLRKKIIAN